MSEIKNFDFKEIPKIDEKQKDLNEINDKITTLELELNMMADWVFNIEKKSEIEENIKSLKEKRESILVWTKKELNIEKQDLPITKEDNEILTNEIKNTPISISEKERLLKEIDNVKSTNQLEQKYFWEWIGALILKFIAFLTWYKNDREFDDNIYYNEYKNSKLIILDADKEKFVKEAKPLALEIEKKFGIPWQVSLAQWALESWWWKSELAQKDWNFFGIKAVKWQQWVNYKTKEEWKDWLYETTASFRKFNWMQDSFYWYAKFLAIDNPRYKSAFKYGYDINPKPDHYPSEYSWYNPLKFLIEIKKAWYATDKNYIQKTSWIIKSIEKIEK